MSNGIPFSPIPYQPPMTEGEILEADLEQSLTDFDDIIAGNIDVINNIFSLPETPISPPPLHFSDLSLFD